MVCKLYKLFFTFLIPVLLAGNAHSQDKPVNPNGFNQFFHANGKVSSEGNMRDGKPDGYWKTYSLNGKLKSEGNRKDFLLDSTWKFYDEKGLLITEFSYKSDKKSGPKKNYKDGKLLSEETYEDDIKHGVTRYFGKGGYVQKTVPFVKGKEDGAGREFDANGTIITLTSYKNGFITSEERINRTDKNNLKQGVWKTFYENGNVKTEGRYRDDKKDGYFKEYALDGNLLKTEKYVEGILQKNVAELVKLDTRNEFYESGKVKTSGTFKNGTPEGVTREYSEEGKIIGSKMFKEGNLVGEGIYDERGFQQGPWIEYHVNGQIKSKGVYEDGKRVGEWVFYHPNGKLEQKGKYLKGGRPTGEWRWYYESGNILREEQYSKGLPDGNMIEYNDSGRVISKGSYIDGEEDGPWFYEVGEIKEEGSFKNGARDGLWKSYYLKNGKLASEGKFIDGNPDGMHYFYFENGRVSDEGKYIVGKKEGTWKKYNEDGVLLTTTIYKDGIEVKIDGLKVPITEAAIGNQ